MALKGVEGFEQYNPSTAQVTLPQGGTGNACVADLEARNNGFVQWTFCSPTATMPTGRFSYGQCLSINPGRYFDGALVCSFQTSPTFLTVGFAFITGYPLAIGFGTSETSGGLFWPHFSVLFSTNNGQITVYGGYGAAYNLSGWGNNDMVSGGLQYLGYPLPSPETNNYGIIAISAPNCFQVGIFQYFELQFQLSTISAGVAQTNGSITVKSNNTTVISATGIQNIIQAESGYTQPPLVVDTESMTPASLQNGLWAVTLDDMYWADATSSAGLYPCNSFVGDLRVKVKLPNGVGNSTEWTPGSNGGTVGANWQQVSHGYSLGDTEYNSSVNPEDSDLYAMSATGATTTTAIAVQTVVSARKTDAGSRQFCPQIQTGTLTSLVGTHELSSEYGYFFDLVPTNPLTSTTWTITTGVDEAQVGIYDYS
jgi:hypothetical protein